MNNTAQTGDPQDITERQIVSTRVLNFPRELVFKAYTDPDALVHWWGPNGFTNTFHEFDLRPGGNWEFIMHGPNGTNYPNKATFVEIAKPERLIFDHVSAPEFRVTVTFENLGPATRVIFTMLFATTRLRQHIATFAVQANEENFDRVTAQLAKMV